MNHEDIIKSAEKRMSERQGMSPEEALMLVLFYEAVGPTDVMHRLLTDKRALECSEDGEKIDCEKLISWIFEK